MNGCLYKCEICKTVFKGPYWRTNQNGLDITESILEHWPVCPKCGAEEVHSFIKWNDNTNIFKYVKPSIDNGVTARFYILGRVFSFTNWKPPFRVSKIEEMFVRFLWRLGHLGK